MPIGYLSSWWNMLSNWFVVEKQTEKNVCWIEFLAYGTRCTCPEDYSGNFCQYKKSKFKAKLNDNLPRAEYRQFDAETLAVIANLGSSSKENTQRMNGLSSSLTVATGNHSQFVFCLTNPCENGGTCFVTNTATTKVRLEEQLKGKIWMVFFFVSRASVFVVMDILVITVKILIIEHPLVYECRLVIAHQVHV